MKLTILVALAAAFILFYGFEVPSLFFIGFLWTSLLYPSAFITLPIPFSLIFGLLCVGSYAVCSKEKLGRPPIIFYVAIAFAFWVTFTTFRAVDPDAAWQKWSWATESILITVAAPLCLRTRAQLETAFIVAFSAFSSHVLTAGIKTFFGTGGYDRLGTLMQSNNWLGETSTLALVAILSIAMASYAANHSEILAPYRGWYLKIAFFLYSFIAVMCVIGTSARTGLIVLAAFLVTGIKGFIRKIAVITCAVLFVLYGQSLLPSKSLTRFTSILTYTQDDSAEIRIGVWKWALQYAAQNPFGGGFSVFYTNQFDYTKEDAKGRPITKHVKSTAPHSVYFEVLGEHGYPGAIMFASLIAGGLWGSFRLSQKKSAKTTDAPYNWACELSRTLFICLILFCAGASFVGIAFQPLLYTFLGFYCSLYRIVGVRTSDAAVFNARSVNNAVPA